MHNLVFASQNGTKKRFSLFLQYLGVSVWAKTFAKLPQNSREDTCCLLWTWPETRTKMKVKRLGGVIPGNVLTCVKSFSNRGYKLLCLSFSRDNNNNYETAGAEESKRPFSR